MTPNPSRLAARRRFPRIDLFRAWLRVELLEERTVLSASLRGLGLAQAVQGRHYTRTEVVASIRAANPLADLNGALQSPVGRQLAGEINWATTQRLYGRNGVSTVQVGVAPSADPLRVVRDLEALPDVQWASPNFVYNPPASGGAADFTPDDPFYNLQYHHPLMQNDQAWDITTGSPSVIIAVTDSGVALNHEDLYQNIWINQCQIPASRMQNLVDVDGDGLITFHDLNDPVNQGPFKVTDVNHDGRIDAADLLARMDVDGQGNDLGTGGWANGTDNCGNGFVDDLVGWDFTSNRNDPDPIRGAIAAEHGTHVAGIAAASVNNGVGVAGTAGGATIMPIRWYGNEPWTSTIIARSYAYAVDNGARIVSTSYNVDQFVDDPIFLNGVDYMYQGGALHFNSAGNNSQENPPRARIDESLYVVATDNMDHKASYSNYGYNVDISAPGDNIYSTFPTEIYPAGYGYDSGTSMATPNTAGAAALIWSLHPDWTREQVAAQLLGTADNIDALNPTQCRGSCAGKLGAGRVNSYRALTEQLVPPRLRAVLGLPDEGQSTTAHITAFQVDVANVFDAATVENASNWEIREAGPDGIFDTDDDVVMSIRPTNDYFVGTNRLFFNLDTALPPGTYQFRAYAGLTDPFGTALDGDGSGQAGTAFVRNFVVLDPGGAPGTGGHGLRPVAGLVSLATALAVEQTPQAPAALVPAPVSATRTDATGSLNAVAWSATPTGNGSLGVRDTRIVLLGVTARPETDGAVRWDETGLDLS